MTRSIRFHSTGGPEVLQHDEVDVPAPGAHEVRIRTRALGINRTEVDYRLDRHLVKPESPAQVGYEAAGVIDAVGPDVEGQAEGDAVSVVPAFMFTAYGGLIEMGGLSEDEDLTEAVGRITDGKGAQVGKVLVTVP